MGTGSSGLGAGGVRKGVSDAAKALTINGQTIADIVAPYINKYKYVALRTQEEEFQLGDIDHSSSVWINGNETSKKLTGISATSVKSNAVVTHSDQKTDLNMQRKYANSGYYFGSHVAVLVSNSPVGRGTDVGEIILKNAKVVKILK